MDSPTSSNLPVARSVSIPGTGTRRVAAYSVSLRDRSFDFSPIPVEADASLADGTHVDGTQNKNTASRCAACGQCMPQVVKIQQVSQRSYGSVAGESRSQQLASFASRSLPATLDSDIRAGVNFNGESSGRDGDGSEHCHGVQIAEPNYKARRQLIVASALCLVFMVGEIVGGYLANSLAIATDAAHLLTDFASFMISLFSLWVASRPATKRMSFGWYRAEVLGALISVLLIWVVTGILVYLAIGRLINKDFDIDAKVMLITSGVGVAVNILMGLTLHQHGHSHGGLSHAHTHDAERQSLLSHSHSHEHSHSHSHSVTSTEPDTNINVRAAFIHVVGDFIQSLGVLVAALIIYYKPEWSVVDPICTFLFSVLVLLTTVAILRDALMVLMEGIPQGLDFNAVQEAFLSIEGVIRVHNLRIWALSMDKTALAAHLAVGPGVSTQQVLLKASRLVRSKFNVFEMTLQIEEFETGMEDCKQCQGPED